MLTRDPKHEALRQQFVRLDAAEARRRTQIRDRADRDYIPPEVLASVVRARFGAATIVLHVASIRLQGDVLRLVAACLRRNPQYQILSNSNSELLVEATSYTWEKLVRDRARISLSEVRLLPFVEHRVNDFVRQVRAKKNRTVSLESLERTDEDGNARPFLDTMEEGRVEQPETGALCQRVELPEAALVRSQTSAALNRALYALPADEGRAIFLYVMSDFNWAQTARLLGCSIPTARKRLELGLTKLRGGRYEE
jgi:RNA polymerase sigma factor (sigma-70 family)